MKFGFVLLLSVVSLQAELKPRIDPLLLDLRQAARCNQYSRDIDGDGDKDILLLSQGTDGTDDDLSLYLEKQADGTYSEALFFAAPRAQEAVSAQDLNGDGRLDPIVLFRESVDLANFSSQFGARWYPSLPEGGYSDTAITSVFPTDSNDVEFGFTDDGTTPFLLRRQTQSDSEFALVINNLLPGENFGDLEASIVLPNGLTSLDLTKALWGNFDNTGKADLLLFQVAGSWTTVYVLTRDQDFSASPEPLFTVNSSDQPIHVDDLNQDGLDDIWVPVAFGGIRYLLRDALADDFLLSQTQLIPSLASSVSLGWAKESADDANSPLVYLALSGGDPTTAQNLLSTTFGEWTVSSTPTDFSSFHQEPSSFSPFLTPLNDRPLLIEGSSSQPGISMLSGFSVTARTSSIYQSPLQVGYVGERLGIGQWTSSLSEVNFDLLTRSPINSKVVLNIVQSSNGAARTAADFIGSNISLSSNRTSLSVGDSAGHPFFPADYNDDGLMDLVVGPDAEQNFWLRLNQGNADFSSWQLLDLLPQSYRNTHPNLIITQLIAADLDQDGATDLLLSYLDSDDTTLANDQAVCLSALNNGDGTFTLPASLPAPFIAGYLSRDCGTIGLIDWDKDGDLDIIDSSVGWRENLGSGNFSPNTRFLAPPGIPASDAFGNPTIIPTTISFGDVNGDGNTDILTSLYAYESAGQRYVLDPVSGTLLLVPDSIYVDSSQDIRSLAAVLLSDEIGRITQTITLPINLAASDVFGNPFAVGPTLLSDLNLDGFADIVTASPAIDVFGNPISLGSRWIQSRGGTDPFLPNDFFNIATITGIGGPLRDFDGNGTLEHSTPYSFVTPTVYGPEYSPLYDFKGPRYELISTSILEDFDSDGDLDALYRHGESSYLSDDYQTYFLVRNLILDETSGITFAMRELGILGADANPNSDPDGDGKSNFEELILGCDPQVADPSNDRSRTTPILTAENELQFSVNKAAQNAGISYRLQYSDDMSQWQPAEATFLADEDSLWETWQALPSEMPRCFYRLIIEP
ncbi:MAG: FG-GAP repeat domain-containing protein [Roseibacillus sp.]